MPLHEVFFPFEYNLANKIHPSPAIVPLSKFCFEFSIKSNVNNIGIFSSRLLV